MSTTSHDTPLKRTMRWTISIYVCILVLALMPYVQRPAEGVKWLATAWTATILSLLWLIDVYRTGERRGITLLPLILAGFIGIHLLATFLSSYTRLGIFGLREYASLFALALASGHAFSEPRQVWPALVAFCSAMTVASLYGFCQKFGLDPFPWAINDSPEYLGLPSTFGNPNYAAHALVLGIVSSLVLALRPATRWCGALCAIMVAHLYFTGYRSGVISLGAAATLVGLVWWLRRGKATTTETALRGMGGLVVLGMAAVIAGMVFTKLFTGSWLPLDPSILIRYNAYLSAVRMILANPVFGVGFKAYPMENPSFWTPYEQQWFAIERKVNEHVHNDSLEAGIEAGLGGSLFYVAMFGLVVFGSLVYALHNADKQSNRDAMRLGWLLACAVTVFAIDGLFGFNLHTPVSAGILFLLFGIYIGVVAPHVEPSFRRTFAGISVAVVALSAGLLSSWAEVWDFRAQRHYHTALSAAEFRKLDDAVQYGRLAESLVPWDNLYPLRLGQFALNQSKPLDALEAFLRSAAMAPNAAMSQVSVARAALSASINAQLKLSHSDVARLLSVAETYGNRALALCPMLPEAHEVLGNTYMLRALASHTSDEVGELERASWERARGYYVDALSYGYINQGEVHKRLAQTALALKNDPACERHILAAVAASPTDLEAWGVFREYANRAKRQAVFSDTLFATLGDVSRSAQYAPDQYVELTLLLARSYREQKRDRTEIQEILQQAILMAPERLEVWGNLVSFRSGGDLMTALREYLNVTRDRLLASGKGASQVIERLTAIAIPNEGAWDVSADNLQRFCAERSARTAPTQLRQEFAWLANAVARSLESSSLSVERKSLGQRNLGLVFAMCELWPPAEELMARAQTNLPEKYRLSNMMQHTEVLSRMGKHNEALLIARDAQAAEPRAFQPNLVLARKMVAAGHIAEARQQYEALLKAEGLQADMRATVQGELAALK